ncbi:MAG: glycosyltransferase family 2 protein [Verrucomicrobiota bacterium]|nr:glycosyltransferase family 2 protein [Verrucomicrobiota bacterium]
MNLDLPAGMALALAMIPAGLFLLNLLVYRPLPKKGRSDQAMSILIPARNEEKNIRQTLESVLQNPGAEFEIIVLDDSSSDGTAEIVREFAAKDSRVRLETAPPLPAGWCGKQYACHVLAKMARNPWLVFMDADVRLNRDALARMSAFMEQSGADLASGVPRQELGTVSEKLLLPLIHFILLGFLSMHAMRHTRWVSMSAGCGQLFIARRAAYEACGGHAKLRDSLHDGIKLPRVFRQAGFFTDLFDATDIATCRMYQTDAETWRGLGKNAVEGLAAPGVILPMSMLLVTGQVLPFVLLAIPEQLSQTGFILTLLATFAALFPRWVAARLFQQPFSITFLHPVAILALLTIQWHALARHLLGKPSEWKGRSYGDSRRVAPLKI